MPFHLPPLRALHVFEAFGRLGSVNAAAHELGVTAGAVSQQLKILEEYLERPVSYKDGRNATVPAELSEYHQLISEGFEQLRRAQHVLSQENSEVDLKISGLPTLLLKWLNPKIHRFQAEIGEVAIRLDATHAEPDPLLSDQIFRLTYGHCVERFPHRRALFSDTCFPVCSPEFLAQNPQAHDIDNIRALPWIDIDWGPAYASPPSLADWLQNQNSSPPQLKPKSVHSLSSLALEAAAAGQGIVLAQSSFVSLDLELGRLVRLSDQTLPMPDPYYICWGKAALDRPHARAFLNWIIAQARSEGA